MYNDEGLCCINLLIVIHFIKMASCAAWELVCLWWEGLDWLLSSLMSCNVTQTLHGELLLHWFLSILYTKPYVASFVQFTSCGEEPKITYSVLP